MLDAFGTTIANGGARRVVYLSTIGVYGDHGGAWIDEDTAPQPGARPHGGAARTSSGAGANCSAIGSRCCGWPASTAPAAMHSLELRRGRARRIVKPGQVFNRIHADDIARAIMGAIACDRGGSWNICDDEPAPPQDVIAYAAELMGMTPPPEQPFETAELSPMARSFYASNRRVRNIRMKHELGVTLAYPTYRAGLDALWQAGEGCI